MRTVHKYPLTVVDHQVVYVPGLLKVLDVQHQRGQLNLWCAIASDLPEIDRVDVWITGTNLKLPEVSLLSYFRTVQLSPELVLHIFLSERGPHA